MTMTESTLCPIDILTDAYAPIAHHLDRAMVLFERELETDLPFIEELLEVVRSYRGKMLRPALLLLTAKACGKVSDEHEILAAVVEMVHMATLVHDDVLDGADVRRRRPTVAALSGNTTAVLLGDFLISHAFHLCSFIGDHWASRRIAAATNTVCEGEMLQNHHGGDLELSEERYLDIISRKTAALTAVSCELGVTLAGAEASIAQAARSFGLSAGIAFQIVDDVLDLVGEEDMVGKTLGRDAELGKLTLPLIHCLATAPKGLRERLMIELCGSVFSRTQLVEQYLAPSGSIDYAMCVARRHLDCAKLSLNALPDTPARQSLSMLTDFIVSRRI